MVTMTATRRLIVLRHAKAGELPGGPDMQRELRPRGRRDSVAAGDWLKAGGILPDLVLCSPAARTRQTWEHVSAVLGTAGGQPEVRYDPRLYGAEAEDLLAILAEEAGTSASLMYIGHNPAAAELAAILAGHEIVFPTCALAVFELTGGWDGLSDPEAAGAGAARLVASWTPREGTREAGE